MKIVDLAIDSIPEIPDSNFMVLRISSETWTALRAIGHRADTADDLVRRALKMPPRDKTKLWKRKK